MPRYIYDGDGTFLDSSDGSLTFAPSSPFKPPASNAVKKIPASMVGPNSERVASLGPWVAADGEPYRLAQLQALDPNGATKVTKFVQGIRTGNYGNAFDLQMYQYGYSIYECNASSTRYRMNKLSSGGANESGLLGYGYYDDLQTAFTAFEKRGVFMSVPIEKDFVAASGTDGGIILWDPYGDEETDMWQFRWQGRTSGQLDGTPLAVAGGRLNRMSTNTRTTFPQFNGQWFHGLSASRLAAGPYVIKIEELDRAIGADGLLKSTITVTRPDGTAETIDALDSIEHVMFCAIGTQFSAKNPAVSYPAGYNDNYNSVAPDGNNGIRYGQVTRMPASIDFRTWKPAGWTGDESPLSLMRLVGRAWQKHGVMLVDMGGSMGIAAQTNDQARRNAMVARLTSLNKLPGGYVQNMTLLPVEQIEACAVRTS